MTKILAHLFFHLLTVYGKQEILVFKTLAELLLIVMELPMMDQQMKNIGE